ncbi:type III-B CRISPR module RAMP protein Cmr1 [bacterium]|nr:type III-B CRISPR module RAMP protein Cmr1 [bacterium]
MLKFEVKLRTITPTFMYGADGKTPEIRPQSIKGLLRFWYRALSCEDDLAKLHEAESEIFGNSDEKIGSAKVSVRVKEIVGKLNEREFLEEEKLDFTTNQGGKKVLGFRSKNLGIGYFYHNQFEKNYFKTETEFTVVLSAEEKYKDKLEKTICALWALVYFGGIGSRSRRTAGNLEVVETTEFQNEKLPAFKLTAKNSETILDFLTENFSKIQNFVELKETQKFSNLFESNIDVVNSSFKTWNEALNSIGNSFRNFRLRKQPDYKNVKDFIQTGQNVSEVTRTAFGLPLAFRFGSLQGKSATITSQKFERRSSPLILKTLKTNNVYFVVLIELKGEFLPAGENLKISSKEQRGNSKYFQQSSYSIFDDFTKNLKTEGAQL